MSSPIYVVCTLDNDYVQHCAALIQSIWDNNKNVYVFIISDFIDKANLQILEIIANTHNERLCVINVEKETFGGLPWGGEDFEHISLAAYYRLLIPNLLPLNVEKVLYLDCDIIVNASLNELWSTNLSQFSIAAVEDTWDIAIKAPIRLDYVQKDSYFNTGVLLINVEKLRKKRFNELVFEYIKNHKSKIIFHDQDILNALLHNDKMFLHIKWNMMETFLFEKPRISISKYSDELKNAQMNPTIIHYTGKIKPWYKECNHPYKSLYWHYLRKTPFANSVEKRKYSIMKYFIRKIYRYVLSLNGNRQVFDKNLYRIDMYEKK